MRPLFFNLALLMAIGSFAQQDGVIDDPGDIAFVTISTNGDDGLAFIFLDDCPDGTTIIFNDDEWNGTAFPTTSEGELTWTNNTGSTIERGTVVIIENANDNSAPPNDITVNIGSISESDAGFLISTSDEGIYAFIGTSFTPTSFLAFAGRLPNGGVLTGTGLVEGTTALNYGNFGSDDVVYSGSTSCNGTLTDCQQQFNTPSNFSELTTDFPNVVPSGFGGAILPVELLSFEAIADGGLIQLEWTTASELNNEGFEVYHSVDGVDWSVLDFVQGHGDSENLISYVYDHKSPNPGINYYQLKQIDFDGQYDWLPIISQLFEYQDRYSIYPNPVVSTAQFEGPNIAGTQVQILSTDGKDRLIRTVSGQNKLFLDELPSGHYYLRLLLPEKTKPIRFLKTD